MKLRKLVLSCLSLVVVMVGLGTAVEADAAITSDMKELEVEVKYGGKEVELEYEVKSRGVSASYKNELTGERLSGTAAKAKIEALMASVDIKNDSRETIASKIAAQISTQSYTKFSFEAEFTNRHKVEFSMTKPTTPTTPTAVTLTEFEVEIEYAGKKEIKVDYEVKNGVVKATYRNPFTGEYLSGSQARAKIEPIMNGMDFRNANRSQIISYLLGKLGAGSNYRDFDFEAKYSNKLKIEF